MTADGRDGRLARPRTRRAARPYLSNPAVIDRLYNHFFAALLLIFMRQML
jgi:hypothetical protein